ncbi:head-to-tail stopper [Microbacterium phage Cen1621]|uniref:Head-to-tail stopper n=1 Tax=Microbacterium phage Cen1621 TaxID=2965191 RepID=A0A9E7QDE4_9CAUD|nr:head-to-tail stopper [Microbacterium phage Cen1621]
MLTTLASPAPIYRLRPTTTTDSVGDPVTSWATPQRDLIPRAAFDDGTSTGEARIEGTAELVIVGSFDLKAADRIEYGGEVWRIDGKPVVARSLVSGVLVHAKLVRVEVTR